MIWIALHYSCSMKVQLFELAIVLISTYFQFRNTANEAYISKIFVLQWCSWKLEIVPVQIHRIWKRVVRKITRQIKSSKGSKQWYATIDNKVGMRGLRNAIRFSIVRSCFKQMFMFRLFTGKNRSFTPIANSRSKSKIVMLFLGKAAPHQLL